MGKKKALIITYYWPPSGGAGVQRWLYFAKYLPEFGIEPIVLTVSPEFASYPQQDESLLKQISPDLKLYKTKSFELYQLYSFISAKKEIPYGGFANESNPSLVQKIGRFVRGNLFLPDARKGWNKYAYRKAIALIKEFDIDTVITTSPPHSTQLIGLQLKKELGIRWIADLRDPWTDIYFYKMFYHTALARWYDKKMEQKVIQNCDVLTTVSQDLLRLFGLKNCPGLNKKALILPNGYNQDDFLNQSITKHSENSKYTITYTGTFADSYNINAFCEAVNEFARIKPTKMQFVGKMPENVRELLKQKLSLLELEFIDYVKHKESIAFIQNSDALLLAIPEVANNKGILTGKFFEYLAARKPIIAIGPVDGDLAVIMQETACGKMFDYSDKKGVMEFLQQITASSFTFSPKNVEAYSRKNLSKQLAKVIVGE